MIPSFSLRHVTAGFAAVVVGYSSAIVIVIDLARKAGANDDMIISWLLALLPRSCFRQDGLHPTFRERP